MIKMQPFHSIILFLILIFATAETHADWKLNPRFLADVYNESTNIKRQDGNWIVLLQSLQGIRTPFGNKFSLDLYLKERVGGDANREYWNNRGEIMLGARINFSKFVYLGAFTELVEGRYFGAETEENPFTGDLQYNDFRAGLVLWHGWIGNRLTSSSKVPLNFWDEVYGDAIYYRTYEENIIYYLNGKFGMRLSKVGNTAFDLYATNYFMLDRIGDYWNNKLDLGLGFRIKPWSGQELSFFVEYLAGSYVDRNGRYENTRNKNYRDIRAGLIFWYGLGF